MISHKYLTFASMHLLILILSKNTDKKQVVDLGIPRSMAGRHVYSKIGGDI